MPDTTTASGPKLVFLIRHWEKPGDPAVDNDADGPNLSTRDCEAAAFAINIPATFPKPDFLLATQQSKQSNQPVETIIMGVVGTSQSMAREIESERRTTSGY